MVDDRTRTRQNASAGTENVYDIMKEYDRWAKEQNEAKERWRQRIVASVEQMMKQAEEGRWLTEHEAEQVDREQTAVEEVAGERLAVAEDVILQHKQSLLDEWETAEDVWAMQAETWAGKCTICRIRKGARVKHDWRECPVHGGDVARVELAHTEVEKGVLSIESGAHLEGQCPECQRLRNECWMQVRHPTSADCCRYAGVVTESVAAIMAIGPEMVEAWQSREGRRRGAGVTGVETFTQLRFGALDVGRLWRTFGWVGMWDIRRAQVDNVCAKWEERLRSLTKKDGAIPMEGGVKRERLYGVMDGRIGRGSFIRET